MTKQCQLLSVDCGRDRFGIAEDVLKAAEKTAEKREKYLSELLEGGE